MFLEFSKTGTRVNYEKALDLLEQRMAAFALAECGENKGMRGFLYLTSRETPPSPPPPPRHLLWRGFRLPCSSLFCGGNKARDSVPCKATLFKGIAMHMFICEVVCPGADK
jgi:hypothetical protein